MSKKRIYTCTVRPELLEAWKKLRRRGDTLTIAKECGYSRPAIDHALNYGYVTLGELPNIITKFFMDRLNAEKEQSAQLLALHDELEEIKK